MSVECHVVRYTHCLGHGDSKDFIKVVERSFGDEQIRKIESIEHG